jgi:hypothetical protein
MHADGRSIGITDPLLPLCMQARLNDRREIMFWNEAVRERGMVSAICVPTSSGKKYAGRDFARLSTYASISSERHACIDYAFRANVLRSSRNVYISCQSGRFRWRSTQAYERMGSGQVREVMACTTRA